MNFLQYFKIWHWLNALVIIGLIGTVFLRKTFLSWRINSEILMQKLLEFDIIITEEQAKILAQSIRARMWEWHIVLGYILVALILYRVILYFTTNHTTIRKKSTFFYIFYIFTTFMIISGFIIYFHDLLKLNENVTHDIKELHESIYNFFLFFIPFHIGSVLYFKQNK